LNVKAPLPSDWHGASKVAEVYLGQARVIVHLHGWLARDPGLAKRSPKPALSSEHAWGKLVWRGSRRRAIIRPAASTRLLVTRMYR
jgi:hypothetical protein